jgi:hypothetical protein
VSSPTTTTVTGAEEVWSRQSRAAKITVYTLPRWAAAGVKLKRPVWAANAAFCGTPAADSVTSQPGIGDTAVTVKVSVVPTVTWIGLPGTLMTGGPSFGPPPDGAVTLMLTDALADAP